MDGRKQKMSQNVVNRGIDNTTGKETVIKATNNALDVVLRGNDGSIQTLQSGLKHKANYSGSSTVTHTVTGNAVTITNDGASDLTVTINSIVTTVLAGETIDKSVLCYDSFTSVIVTTTVAYRLFVYEGI